MFEQPSQPDPGNPASAALPDGRRDGVDRESLLLSLCAWVVILMMVAVEMLLPTLVAVFAPQAQTRAQRSAPSTPNVEFELLARFHIGAKHFFDLTKQKATTTTTAITDLRSKMRTAVDTIHLVPLAVELGDMTTAMSELDALLDDDALPAGLRRDADALETIYRQGGPDKLDDAARERLLSRHKWFADLALSHGKPDTDPHRQAANGLATRTFAGMLVAILAAGSLGLVALFLSIGLIVLLALGRMRSAYRIAVPSAPGLFASLGLTPTAPRAPRDSSEFVAPVDLLGDSDRLTVRPVASQPPPVPPPHIAEPQTNTDPPLTQIFENAPTDVSVYVQVAPSDGVAQPTDDDLFSRKPDDGQASSLGMKLPEPPPAAPPAPGAAQPAMARPTPTPPAGVHLDEPVAPAQPRARRGPYVEAFAIYMVTFLGFSLVLSFCFPRSTLNWIWFYLPVGIAVATWPILRGVKWGEFRRAIGLHRGRGVVIEILCGLGGYLSGVPLLLAGFIATFVLVKTQQFVIDNWPSTPDVVHVTPAPVAETPAHELVTTDDQSAVAPPNDTPASDTMPDQSAPASASDPATPARESVVTADESVFAPPNVTPQRNTMPTHPIINEIKPGSGVAGFIGLFLLAAVWAPFSEELFFRGFLYHHLRGRCGWIMSAILVGIVFAAVHPQGWTAIPVLGSIAFILAGIREWRGSLIGPIAAHAFNNGMLVCFMYLVLG